ncbi:hypothetical protein AB9M75_10580 [Lactobacillus sp. AN1001]
MEIRSREPGKWILVWKPFRIGFCKIDLSYIMQARKWKKDNIQLEKEFLIEWPLERIKIMELAEYVIGKGPENKSLCYEFEFGKYCGLYLSIKDGFSAKFGVYCSKKHHAHCDKINQPIPELKLRSKFEKLKIDLIVIS